MVQATFAQILADVPKLLTANGWWYQRVHEVTSDGSSFDFDRVCITLPDHTRLCLHQHDVFMGEFWHEHSHIAVAVLEGQYELRLRQNGDDNRPAYVILTEPALYIMQPHTQHTVRTLTPCTTITWFAHTFIEPGIAEMPLPLPLIDPEEVRALIARMPRG